MPPRRRAVADDDGNEPPRGGVLRALAWAIGGVVLFAVVLPVLLILLLRFVPPPTTAFMMQSPTKPVSYDWVPARSIAEVARQAVIAAEDQKFRDHRGFDFEAISRAMEENPQRERPRGASTISQQVAKNLFLWPGGGMLRKGIEAGLTVLIELFWSKDRILEVYLNIAEFGPGVYGVEAASRAFFDKQASDLSAPEAARLAAVLPSPRRWSAAEPGDYVQQRSQWVLRQMGYRNPGQNQERPRQEDPTGRPWWEQERDEMREAIDGEN